METKEVTVTIGHEEKIVVITERSGMAKQQIKKAAVKGATVDSTGNVVTMSAENLIDVEDLEIKLSIKAYPLGATTYEKLIEQISGDDFDKLQEAIRELNTSEEITKKLEG